jgi:sec-independent protein translocase protein TatB
MSGVGFSELIILALIGLIVLGPERLPRVASQLGSWIGQARRMTRVMRRQLQDELDFEKDLTINPSVKTKQPRDDDTFSPAHEKESQAVTDRAVGVSIDEPVDKAAVSAEKSAEKDA